MGVGLASLRDTVGREATDGSSGCCACDLASPGVEALRYATDCFDDSRLAKEEWPGAADGTGSRNAGGSIGGESCASGVLDFDERSALIFVAFLFLRPPGLTMATCPAFGESEMTTLASTGLLTFLRLVFGIRCRSVLPPSLLSGAGILLLECSILRYSCRSV